MLKHKLSMKPQALAPPPPIQQQTALTTLMLESSEDELTVDEIIKTKPKTKIVRDFFAATLATIKSDDAILFE